jgi:hypothetical protein
VKRATMGLGTFAVVAAAIFGGLALAGPAGARQKCSIVPKSALVPYLLSPCDGATVKANGTVTFRIHDANSQAGQYPPFLNLSTRRVIEHGNQLKPILNGDGLFDQLKRVKGTRHVWTYTSDREDFASWFDNHAGTYYLQVQQVDSRASTDTFYGPITTIHVG